MPVNAERYDRLIASSAARACAVQRWRALGSYYFSSGQQSLISNKVQRATGSRESAQTVNAQTLNWRSLASLLASSVWRQSLDYIRFELTTNLADVTVESDDDLMLPTITQSKHSRQRNCIAHRRKQSGRRVAAL